MYKWFLCLMLLAPFCAWAEDKPASAATGTVQLAEGTVTARHDGVTRVLHAGDPVREGDIVTTGKDSEAELQMADHAYLALRANSELKITNYQATDADKDNAVLELFKGAMRTITGLIGKRNKERFALRTPYATIGIRGTDHEILVMLEAAPGVEPGTYDHVFSGGIVLRNEQGEVEIGAGQAAFSAARGGKGPRILAHVPDFLPKGKHENLLDGRHDAIQKVMHDLPDRREQQDQKNDKQQDKADDIKPDQAHDGGKPDQAGEGKLDGSGDRDDSPSKRKMLRNRLRRAR